MQPFATRSQIEFAPDGCVGLDFGTTNSAIARVTGSRASVAEFATATGPTSTFPSILYFERRREASLTRLTSSAGPAAIERYLNAEEKGRLIQSLKAYLADRRFDSTGVFSQRYTLQDMIALIVQHLLVDAARSFTTMPRRVVVGRPVHFSNAHDDSDDEFALARLLEAITRCGFNEIVFEYEPVAAAYSYEQTLEKDELILIGDFGGGTSDFSILHVGPTMRRRGRTTRDIVGNDGVAMPATRSTGRSSATSSRRGSAWARNISRRPASFCLFPAGRTRALNDGTTCRFSTRRKISRCSSGFNERP